jgi:hypothetical protein
MARLLEKPVYVTKPEPPTSHPVAYTQGLDGPPERYPDERPGMADSFYHDPEPGEDVLFDDGPIFEPTRDDLEWLREQQAACEKLGWDTDDLDTQIRAMERRMTLNAVAAFLARSRFEPREARGAWGGYDDGGC